MNNHSIQDVWERLQDLRREGPLVHNITNFVVMQVTANALLALGGSPVMAHEEEEVAEITSIASALVLNIGTLSQPWIRSMHVAIDAALSKGIPVVIDPVGAGASALRTRTALDLLAKGAAAGHAQLFLRGNASEILVLAGESGATKGVDSTASSASALDAAYLLAKRFKCTVSVSGEVDFVTDGSRHCLIHGGSELMPRITGMGCSASAIAGAFAAVCRGDDPVLPLCATMSVMAAAGRGAARIAKGPGSFLPAFMDNLYTMNQAMLEQDAIIEW